jgi:hypothetical protein
LTAISKALLPFNRKNAVISEPVRGFLIKGTVHFFGEFSDPYTAALCDALDGLLIRKARCLIQCKKE